MKLIFFVIQFQTHVNISILFIRIILDKMEEILDFTDSSFKYIMLGFNFLTLLVVYLYSKKHRPPKKHHVLFVTAHPDDETMFFLPTIKSIRSQYFVHLLCLTGKNTKRQQELAQAAKKLNVDHWKCLQHQSLKDSMEIDWPQQTIRDIVLKYCRQQQIKAIFTFDNHGISNHKNHKSISRAIKKMQTTIAPAKSKKQEDAENPEKIAPIKCYYLQSVNILRKYTSLCEILIAMLKDYSFFNFNMIDMWQTLSFHESQFVWYRKLWVIFSRYTYINTYQRAFVSLNLNQMKQE